jgi:hypothetical protein
MHVFDGFGALTGDQRSLAAPTAAAAQVRGGASADAAVTEAAARSATRDAADAAVVEPALQTPPNAAAHAEESAYARASTGASIFDEPVPHATRNRGRIAACVLLAGLLAVQTAYAFRSQLAARSPAIRTLLGNVCAVFACTVTLPQRPDLLKIEASDVHMLDPGRPGLIQLTATLRSYADYDLAYPALDLVLTNATEHALARRIFLPDEYLGESRDVKTGLPPRAEMTVALDLDTGALNAAGFRVDLLPAPGP